MFSNTRAPLNNYPIPALEIKITPPVSHRVNPTSTPEENIAKAYCEQSQNMQNLVNQLNSKDQEIKNLKAELGRYKDLTNTESFESQSLAHYVLQLNYRMLSNELREQQRQYALLDNQAGQTATTQAQAIIFLMDEVKKLKARISELENQQAKSINENKQTNNNIQQYLCDSESLLPFLEAPETDLQIEDLSNCTILNSPDRTQNFSLGNFTNNLFNLSSDNSPSISNDSGLISPAYTNNSDNPTKKFKIN